MIARTRKTKTSSNEDALAAFVQKKAEIDAMLSRLQASATITSTTAPTRSPGTMSARSATTPSCSSGSPTAPSTRASTPHSRPDLPPPPRAAPAAGARARRRAIMLSADGDQPMTTTDLSKKQLATILSALDDAPRSPANKGEALRAIGRSAKRFGLTTDDVLAAAPGLLDGRMSPADFRVELHDQGSAPVPATEAPQGAPDGAGRRRCGPGAAGADRARTGRHGARSGQGARPRRRRPRQPSRPRLRRPTSPRPAPAPSRPR